MNLVRLVGDTVADLVKLVKNQLLFYFVVDIAVFLDAAIMM